MSHERRNIILSHAFIVNAELSESDRSARVGYASAVSKDVFKGFDYVALGHIHKPQVIASNIRYSGSPIKYSFGAEEKQEKGVVMIDTDTMEQSFIPLSSLRDRRSVSGTYDEILAKEDEIKNDYLRLHVTDRYAGLELQSELRERFPFLLEVYGKSLTENGELSVLSVEDVEKLDEIEIMIKFMEENHSYTPTQAQMELFREALAKSREESDKG